MFAAVFVAVWLAAMTLYQLVVQQWGLVRYGYDWAYVYAPLIAIGCGGVAAFYARRRLSTVPVILRILVVGLIALFGGILLFGLGGLI